MSHTHSLTDVFGHISVVRDQFGRSLQVCHLEFDDEAITDSRSENSRYRGGGRGGFLILSNFRELSFCGPFGPCLII